MAAEACSSTQIQDFERAVSELRSTAYAKG